MLRTFDELDYRQEPRFHLELGLMKLVHLQRLLPIEEALSHVGHARAGPPPPNRTRARATSVRARPTAASRQPRPVARPAFSPFEQDRLRQRPEVRSRRPIYVSCRDPAPFLCDTRGATARPLPMPHAAAGRSSPKPLPCTSRRRTWDSARAINRDSPADSADRRPLPRSPVREAAGEPAVQRARMHLRSPHRGLRQASPPPTPWRDATLDDRQRRGPHPDRAIENHAARAS